ncbi:MAG: hypothetical protein Q8P76_00385 [bacterium]|nr:hypothetical protein [bacterium]
MNIVLIAIAAYLGLVYVICWMVILGKILSGGMPWKDAVFAGLFAPLYVAFAIIALVVFSPRKAWTAVKREIEMRKN